MDVEDITECLGEKADLIAQKCEFCPVREKCWQMIHQETEIKEWKDGYRKSEGYNVG